MIFIYTFALPFNEFTKMDKATFKPVYNRKKGLLSDGTALIQIEAYLNGKRKYFTTSIYITPKQWDKKNKKVKDHPNSIKLNKQISDKIAGFENLELDRLNSGKTFSLDLITEHLNGKLTTDFIKFFDSEIKQTKGSQGTKTTHTTTLNTLKDYKSVIPFTELNYELLTGFERFLRSKGLGINTINKYFRHIRKYVNLAINKELFDLNRYPFRKFKAPTEETHREPLSPEELEGIEKVTIPEDQAHLKKVLDMFLFSCYSGLRFSDLTALKHEHIVLIDGIKYIDTRMIKTNTQIKIPLSLLFNGKPIEILDRYINTERKYLFDELTNQYVNRCLKDIAVLAKIKKNITFHTARHTQATYLLSKNVSITTVQKLLGHKKLQTTMIYSKVLDRAVINELMNTKF